MKYLVYNVKLLSSAANSESPKNKIKKSFQKSAPEILMLPCIVVWAATPLAGDGTGTRLEALVKFDNSSKCSAAL